MYIYLFKQTYGTEKDVGFRVCTVSDVSDFVGDVFSVRRSASGECSGDESITDADR